ncbi:hypothetical protein AVEN_141765-1 [Araneus ventricosus]|uniref:Uncharacterized protein n=1 Tax=Araneus ventricosus TaxID=182803 RepID=A0A4Y2NPK8_ARAVE|nr:hypothetical protein AVEN_141765-1 [Araneus ventricosus]
MQSTGGKHKVQLLLQLSDSKRELLQSLSDILKWSCGEWLTGRKELLGVLQEMMNDEKFRWLSLACYQLLCLMRDSSFIMKRTSLTIFVIYPLFLVMERNQCFILLDEGAVVWYDEVRSQTLA